MCFNYDVYRCVTFPGGFSTSFMNSNFSKVVFIAHLQSWDAPFSMGTHDCAIRQYRIFPQRSVEVSMSGCAKILYEKFCPDDSVQGKFSPEKILYRESSVQENYIQAQFCTKNTLSKNVFHGKILYKENFVQRNFCPSSF